MRKSLLTVVLTLFLCLLTGCSRQPDLAGRWETSTNETLCATVLWLNGDHTCTYLQEGRSLDGTWQLRRNALTLTFPTGSVTLTLDRDRGRLDMGDGLFLYRQSDPDVVGYWMNTSDDASKRVSLQLMDSGLFILQVYDRNLPANTLDGWEEYHTGRWSLSGSLLILRCNGQHRNVLTYRLNGDASRIETDAGIPLKNYMRP